MAVSAEPTSLAAKIRLYFEGFTLNVSEIYSEVKTECNPVPFFESLNLKSFSLRRLIHFPYFPAFHQPGWLMGYILGPFNDDYFERLTCDIRAGLTVTMTLVPQVIIIFYFVKVD